MQYRTAVGVAAGAMVALALLALTVTFHGTSSRTALVQRGQGGVAPEVKVKEVAMRLRRRIAEGTRRSKSLASSRVGGYVHRVKKKALMVPAVLKKGGSRVTELAASPATKSELAPAEEARCVGMLHACQSWLELKDGDKNNIVITSPDDDTKELLNKDVVLPGSGQPIPDKVWGILKQSCKYGLADLRQCDKPSHWPVCTGSGCTGKNAKKSKPSAHKHAGSKH